MQIINVDTAGIPVVHDSGSKIILEIEERVCRLKRGVVVSLE